MSIQAHVREIELIGRQNALFYCIWIVFSMKPSRFSARLDQAFSISYVPAAEGSGVTGLATPAAAACRPFVVFGLYYQ